MARDTKPILAYSQARARRSRRIIAIAMSSAIGIICLSFGRYADVSQRLMYDWAWRSCLTHRLGPETVVYEEDPLKAAALLALGGEYHAPDKPLFEQPWSPVPPPEWGPPAEFTPKAFARVDTSIPPRPFIKYRRSVVFTHARALSGGTPQCVLVEYGACARGPSGHKVLLQAFILDKRTWNLGIALANNSGTMLTVKLGSPGHLRLYAGQADPADASHFTIRYAIDGQHGVIDGWLRAKRPGASPWKPPFPGPFVELDVRDGPAAVIAERDPEPDSRRWLLAQPKEPKLFPAKKRATTRTTTATTGTP